MATFKEKTKEELVVAFKKAIGKKRVWEEEAQKEFAQMREQSIIV